MDTIIEILKWMGIIYAFLIGLILIGSCIFVISYYGIYEPIKMIKETGCDFVMISRGSIGNPWIFSNINKLIMGENDQFNPSKEDKINMCLKHTRRLIDIENSEINAIKQMRGIVGYYIKGFKGALKARQSLNNITTYKELENILNNIE